jgi:hypothetical protein
LIFTRRDKPNMQILYPRLRKNHFSQQWDTLPRY